MGANGPLYGEWPVTAKTMYSFLEELANLREDSVARFRKRFGNWFWMGVPIRFEQRVEGGGGLTISGRPVPPPDYEDAFKEMVWPLRNCLYSIWRSEGSATKQRAVVVFCQLVTGVCVPTSGPRAADFLDSAPLLGKGYPVTPAEDAAFLLLKSVDKLRVCKNRHCSTPYFFAQRSNQKFCSEPCARPVQQMYKRQWWARNGQEWRNKKARKSSKGGKTNGRNLSKRGS
jgi:hypothetical protein